MPAITNIASMIITNITSMIITNITSMIITIFSKDGVSLVWGPICPTTYWKPSVCHQINQDDDGDDDFDDNYDDFYDNYDGFDDNDGDW